jgi:hypothetical protein
MIFGMINFDHVRNFLIFFLNFQRHFLNYGIKTAMNMHVTEFVLSIQFHPATVHYIVLFRGF